MLVVAVRYERKTCGDFDALLRRVVGRSPDAYSLEPAASELAWYMPVSAESSRRVRRLRRLPGLEVRVELASPRSRVSRS